MTPTALQRALIDLGWVTLIHRVLGGKPSSTFALHKMMRCAGRPVALDEIADAYEAELNAGGGLARSHGRTRTGSSTAVRKRVERVRSCLDDLGVGDAIRTVAGESAYIIEKRDLCRIEAALLYACGVQLEPEEAAA